MIEQNTREQGDIGWLNQLVDNVPPLRLALIRGHLDLAKMLVEHGAEYPPAGLQLTQADSELLKHPECLDYFLPLVEQVFPYQAYLFSFLLLFGN